jgi:hypothetical protein
MCIRNSAFKIFFNEYKAAVYKIPISAKKFTIMAIDEFSPCKISIALFRTVDDQEISNRIGAVAFKYNLDPDRPITACGNLFALKCEVLT